MKIIEFHERIMKIIRILECNARITKIKKILEFHARIKKIMKILKILCEDHENIENLQKSQTHIKNSEKMQE